ncbi:MAG: autotransporter outer membrane beta-barrel domain-containing protein [Phascolarctobacterium sp.]|uniref:autotransporter outer membrane beta-barrel domain-containing protein n=1 Tax=Phascolarctobacterium sp. TaxID=2049039 RepID=UPI0026DB8FC6|nr:autotransporter outer membrane beta-barrel domain-containing protein [Phascolarctobacterium sp.]MDO4921616.1 autotransporter outer membrane beta-barrel domain-containing protein [Phascolarctobacterium sp.]
MPLSKALRHSKTAALIALLLGCHLALPVCCAADEDYTWQFNTSSANADVYGPFKLIYLQKGDSIAILNGQTVTENMVIEDDIPADSAIPSLVLPAALKYYGELLGENAADGSIPIYVAFSSQDDYLAAFSTNLGDANGPIYQALAAQGNGNPSDTFIIYNTNGDLNAYDLPRAANIYSASDIFKTTLHELTHSLGMADVVVKTSDGEYKWSDTLNSYSQHLYDIYGTQAKGGQRIVITKTPAESQKDENIFYICAPGTDVKEIKSVTFHGENVDALTNGEGIPILGALTRAANPKEYLSNGSSLSHNNLAISYCNYGALTTSSMITELDLAMLQDMGYKIDRSKYFGKSYLQYGGDGKTSSAVNEKNFTSDRMLAVGTHIYRNNLKLTQKGDIVIAPQNPQDFFSSLAGCGVMISGANNTVNIPQSTNISVSGAAGAGIGVNYGANNTINIAGSIKADGYDGIGLLIASGYENYFSEEAFYSTRIVDGDDPDYLASVKAQWAELAANNAELQKITEQSIEDNKGFSVEQLNITGSLEGDRAAIYVTETNFIKEINVMGQGQIIGDITSGGYNPNYAYVDYLKTKCEVLPETRLTFGRKAKEDGTPDGNALDETYCGIFTGNISNYDAFEDKHNILNYNLELLSGSLDLNKNNPENSVSVLSITTSPGTVLNAQGLLSAETKKYGYPRGENSGQLNIYGTLAPGGDGFGYVEMRGDSFNQGDSGKLKLDFDFSSGQHDAIGLRGWESENYDLDSTFTVNLQNVEFVQKNSYEGAPVLLTREDFFPVVSGDVIINDEQLAASVNNSATQFTKLRDSWALYDFSQGFTPYIDGEAKAVGKILDGRLSISELNQMSDDDWSLYRALMLPGYGGRLNGNARQLSGLSYARQLEASMNVNHLLSGAVRNSIFDWHAHADDEWHWFAAPLAFTSRQQGAGGYSQHGSGILIGADKQTDGNGAGFFGGYLHDSASFRTSDGLHSKRDGGFIGAYFKQAKDRDNGPFTYGFVRYDNSKAKNRRALNINNAYLAEHKADFRQQGGAAELGAGWNNFCGAGTLTWSAGVNYALTTQPAFRETGRGATAIRQTSENYQSLLGNAGVQYATVTKPLNEQTDYQVSVGARWQQELWRSDRNYTISLAGGSAPVHWESDADKGWLELTLQGQLLHKNKLLVTAAAGAELFRKGHRGVSGSLKLEYSF